MAPPTTPSNAKSRFTSHPTRPREQWRDHPRSRGVYADAVRVIATTQGSSPLARGLRQEDLRPPGLRGIIPARAGFTQDASSQAQGGADHPRSRGVYLYDNGNVFNTWGSSPLARGLLQLVRELHGPARIIPARAGFTGCFATMRPGRSDHPRSRGVYVVAGCAGGPVLGIIPARAGFTAPATGTRWRPRDHPRSRGVYSRSTGVTRTISGSSPLARGLPGVLVAGSAHRRIIPARAGFTYGPSRRCAGPADHPRSRGVYALPLD